MFDAEKQEFCHRLVRTPSGLIREGLSPRYTAMTVLGLNEMEKYQGLTPFATNAILNKLLERQDWPEGAGDFGVLLWMTAARAPEKLPALLARLDLQNALERFPDMRQKRTMELAWLLTGLSYAALAKQPGVPDLTEIATSVYTELIRNQGEGGFFGHLDSSSSGAGRLRGRMVRSFADQVYPTIALTRFSQAFSVPKALEQALQCGLGICRVQGPLGQWWWHYDSRTGKVASMYPVFSVHQEAMGPMALFPLGEATGRDFREHIYRGLQWIEAAPTKWVWICEGNLVGVESTPSERTNHENGRCHVASKTLSRRLPSQNGYFGKLTHLPDSNTKTVLKAT